jgi:hypothetical protein
MDSEVVGFTSTIPVEVILAAGLKPVDLNNIFITDENPERFICRQPLDYRSPTKTADPPPPTNNTKTTGYRLSIG